MQCYNYVIIALHIYMVTAFSIYIIMHHRMILKPTYNA